MASRVVPGVPMADIGTDHARLPAWLVRSGTVPTALAMDIAEGPLRAAHATVRSLSGTVEVRSSNGLERLQDGEAGTVTICGMGGQTMSEILRRGLPELPSLLRVVVQPQSLPALVRSVMLDLDWHCPDAVIVREREKLYIVECWERGTPVSPWSAEDLRWGRPIRSSPDPLYRDWLVRELAEVELGLEKMLRTVHEHHPDAVRYRELRAQVVTEVARLP